jgi:hypothetical protein
MKVINGQTGQIEDYPTSEGVEKVIMEGYSLVGGEDYDIRENESNAIRKVKAEEAKELIDSGRASLYYDDDDTIERDLEESSVALKKGMIDKALGAASGLTYGLSETVPLALAPDELANEYRERLKEAKQTDSYKSANFVADLLNPLDFVIGGGVSKAYRLARGAQKGAKAVKAAKTIDKVAEGALQAGAVTGAYEAGNYVSDAYVYDKEITAEELAARTLKAAAIGSVVGGAITGASTAIQARKNAQAMKKATKQYSDSLSQFVEDFKTIDKKDVAKVDQYIEAGTTGADVFKRQQYRGIKKPAVKISYDPDQNVWKYSDDIRDVAVDEKKLLQPSGGVTLEILDIDNLKRSDAYLRGQGLSYFSDIVDKKKLKADKVEEAINEVFLVNKVFTGGEIAKTSKINKNLAQELKGFNKSRDVYLQQIRNGKGSEGYALSLRSRLITKAQELQRKVQTLPVDFGSFKQIKAKKEVNSIIDGFNGFKNGEDIFIRGDSKGAIQGLLGTILDSKSKVQGKGIKNVPKWQKHLIRWAGGNRVASFTDKSAQQLSDAANYIDKNGGVLWKTMGDTEQLSDAVATSVLKSVTDRSDAIQQAVNTAYRAGIDITVDANKIVDFIETLKRRQYTFTSSGKPIPGSDGFTSFLDGYADQWRRLADDTGKAPVTPNELLESREMLDKMVEHFFQDIKSRSPINKDKLAVRFFLEEQIKEAVERLGLTGKEFHQKYTTAKKEYATASLVHDIMVKESNAASARNSLPLTSYLTAGLGATIGATTGTEDGALIGAGLGVIGRKAYKEQGDWMAGQVLKMLDKDAVNANKRIEKSVSRFFEPITETSRYAIKTAVTLQNMKSDTPRQVYEKEKKWLEKLDERTSKLDADFIPLDDTMPEFSNEAKSKAFSAIDFLMSKFPEMQQGLTDPNWHPSTDKLFSYMRFKEAIFNLPDILEDFSKMIISKEQTEVLKTVYPSTHQKLYFKTLDQIEGKRLRQEQRQVLNKVFGLKDSINSAQMMKFRAPEQEDQQQQQQNQRTRKTNRKFTGQERTRNERISER